MNLDFPFMALVEQIERLADASERRNELLEQYTTCQEPLWQDGQPPSKTGDGQSPRHLSLFVEGLPTRNYNHLRQKLIPASVAARILGISPAQLDCLDKHNFIKGKGGRYDVLGILMWLDSDYNPDTEAENAR